MTTPTGLVDRTISQAPEETNPVVFTLEKFEKEMRKRHKEQKKEFGIPTPPIRDRSFILVENSFVVRTDEKELANNIVNHIVGFVPGGSLALAVPTDIWEIIIKTQPTQEATA